MAPFNAEEEVVTLYFISLGFKNKAVSSLLALKCNSTRTADSVGIKWKGSKGLHGMWNIEADDWDLQAVGKYLAEIMPDAVEFEKLISVGAKEEEIVTTAAFQKEYYTSELEKVRAWHMNKVCQAYYEVQSNR